MDGPENGCEDTQNSTTNCGACGRACVPGEICSEGNGCQCGTIGPHPMTGRACGDGETCSGGMCVCGATTNATGPVCGPGQECCPALNGCIMLGTNCPP